MADRSELTGWEQIAAYLGVTARTAQAYEQDYRLPVHRKPGTKGRVWTTPGELDVWKRTGKTPAPAKSGLGAAPTIKKPLVRTALFYALAVVVAVAGAFYGWSILPGTIADFRVQGRNVIAIDGTGRELWRHTFPWSLQEASYAGDWRDLNSWLGDLHGDGEQQLIFAAHPYKEGNYGTSMFCFAANGKVRWSFEPGRAVVDGSGDRMVPPYFLNSLLVMQGKKQTDTRIVVSSNHYLGQADQVAFLDVNGRVLAEYWHPGHLLHLEQVDLKGNGRNELLLAGVNNGNHEATLVMLDPNKMSGVSTPKEMQDHRFELLNMASAREEAVVFFPRSCISAGQPYTRVDALHVTKDRLIVSVSEGVAEGSAGFIYELDHHLRVVNVSPNGIGVEQAHRRLEKEGELGHPFDIEKECARLEAGVIVRREK